MRGLTPKRLRADDNADMRFIDWLTKSHNAPSVPDSRYASAEELGEAFSVQREHLLWLAQVVTGDGELASKCCVDARRLSKGSSGMFRDWLLQWARVATVRSAVECVREGIGEHAAQYETSRCPHGGHASFTLEELEWLGEVEVSTLISELDSFARAVLVVRGVQGAAIQECALTLGASRSAVMSAHCHILRWLTRLGEQRAAHAGAGCVGFEPIAASAHAYEERVQ